MDIVINQDMDAALVFAEGDEITSIVQNIVILLNTRKGSIPLYRDFGLPMEFIDKPAEVAETLATLEISEALEKFEPRAVLKDLWFVPSKEGRMSIQLEVSVKDG